MRRGEKETKEVMEGGEVGSLRLRGRKELMEPSKRPWAGRVVYTYEYIEIAQNKIGVVLGD